MKQMRGVAFTLLSAAMFGFSPILAKYCYAGGTNAVTLVFLRNFLGLPVLLALLFVFKISLRLTLREFLCILPVSLVGSTMTTLLLYYSYNYISVGLSTTLHYCYPIIIIVFYSLWFRQRPGALKWFALVLGLLGVILALNPGASGNLIGIALSLLSGLSYCVYIIAVDRLGLKNMHFLKLTFYLASINSIATFGLALFTGGLQLNMTAQGWGFAVALAMMITVVSYCLLQLGIAYTDPATVSILFTVEPIISVVLGVIILGEGLSGRGVLGMVLILASILLVAVAEKRVAKKEAAAAAAPPAPPADSAA